MSTKPEDPEPPTPAPTRQASAVTEDTEESKEDAPVDIETIKNELSADELEEARMAFELFDADGSGSIDADELKQVMETLGQNLTDDELDELIKVHDADNSGEIDFNEFLAMVHSKSTRSKNASARDSCDLKDLSDRGRHSLESKLCPACDWANSIPARWQERIGMICEKCGEHLYTEDTRNDRRTKFLQLVMKKAQADKKEKDMKLEERNQVTSKQLTKKQVKEQQDRLNDMTLDFF